VIAESVADLVDKLEPLREEALEASLAKGASR
jgi:hypothetical protein